MKKNSSISLLYSCVNILGILPSILLINDSWLQFNVITSLLRAAFIYMLIILSVQM